MHGSAKVEADPIMPAWPTCRGLPTNVTSDHIPDSESSPEDYEVLSLFLYCSDSLLIPAIRQPT